MLKKHHFWHKKKKSLRGDYSHTRETQRRESTNLRRGKARWGRKGREKARQAIRKAREGEVEIIQLSPRHILARQRRERAR